MTDLYFLTTCNCYLTGDMQSEASTSSFLRNAVARGAGLKLDKKLRYSFHNLKTKKTEFPVLPWNFSWAIKI